jgi:peroxiredoxin
MSNLDSVQAGQASAFITKVNGEIAGLPASAGKVQLASTLGDFANRNDPGQAVLQAVADTITKAAGETPAAAAGGYGTLARLVRYDHVTTTVTDPAYLKAMADLATAEEPLATVNFTLKDLKGKKWTLAELKGKIVAVYFWNTSAAPGSPSAREMLTIDPIAGRYADDMVLLAIVEAVPHGDPPDGFGTNTLITKMGFKAPVLMDPGGKVATQFGVTGTPRLFVFDKDGKFVTESTDTRSSRELMMMLRQAGLK